MKQIYLTILLALSTYSLNAQTLTFTDPAFKQRLIDASPSYLIAKNSAGDWITIDTNNDGEIQVSETQDVTFLNFPEPYDITSIEGIQGFTNLTFLSLFGHPLAEADISGMVNLESADVSSTLGAINASGCINLPFILLSLEHTSLNVSGCTSLMFLTIGPNVTEFNITGCSSLENLDFYSGNPNFSPSLDLSGLGLTNLQSVNGSNYVLVNFDAHDCTSLSTISFENITNLNLSNTGFTQLFLHWSNLESVNASNCVNLTSITNSSINPITPLLSNVDITGCNVLTNITITNTQLSEIELSDLSSLQDITLYNNQFTSINASNVPSLLYMNLEYNLFTEFDPTGLDNIESLKIRGNSISEGNFAGMVNLKDIDVRDNNMTGIDISGCTSLQTLEAANNNIVEVDLSEATALVDVYLDFNQLTSLDLNNSPSISWLLVNDNPQLQSLFLKNGGDTMDMIFATNCPQLEYVCADDQDFELLNTYFENQDMDVTVNNTCSFEPSQDYNSISGIVRFDSDTNGCDGTDTVFGDMKFSIQRDAEEAFIFSNNEGNYIAYAEEGVETVILTPEIDSDLFTITPASVTEQFTETGNAITADFCIVPNGTHPDLDVVLLPIFDARPGFEATYQLIINNKGNQIQSGSVDLAYNDAVIDFMSASLTPTTTNTGNLTWDFNELAPFNNIVINLTFGVNTPQEDPSVNVGDILPFTATIIATETDDTPNDNVYQFNQVVIGAIDPNDKQIAEGASITPEQVSEYLHYLIRFQNTGTAEAINIRVEDVLANNLDWDTFTPVSASHEYRVTLTDGNKAEFFFENIMLPAEEDNEPASHGFVAFKIKPLPGAQLGDIFENTAKIYFDFESAIITNTVTTTVEEVMSTDDFNFNSNFTVYPNPSKDIVNIKAKGGLEINAVKIYNMLGQLVSSVENTASTMDANLDISHLQDGQYLLEIRTDKGKSACRLIKQ